MVPLKLKMEIVLLHNSWVKQNSRSFISFLISSLLVD